MALLAEYGKATEAAQYEVDHPECALHDGEKNKISAGISAHSAFMPAPPEVSRAKLSALWGELPGRGLSAGASFIRQA